MATATDFEIVSIPVANISWLKVGKDERSHDKEFVKKIAASIHLEGLHQAVGVRPDHDKPGHFIGIFGEHRFDACANILKWTEIPAKVSDIDETEARIARISENLFHNPFSKAQQAKAVTDWYDYYDRKRTEYESAAAAKKAADKKPAGRPKKALAAKPSENPSDQRQSAAESESFDLAVTGEFIEAADIEAATEIALPPKPPANFGEHVAEITGQSERTVLRALKIGQTFSPDQLEVFAQTGTNQTWMETVAAIEDKSKRDAVVNLIASGMEPEEAIGKINETPEVIRADGKSYEVSGLADTSKPEENMLDEEWVDFHCSEILAIIPDKAAFYAHAILYRTIKNDRQTFKNKTKKAMAEAKKESLFGGFYGAVLRIINISHPKHWFMCGSCSGFGVVSGEGKKQSRCKECGGNGFIVKTEGK